MIFQGFLSCNNRILSILHDAINVVLLLFQVACFSISHWLKSDVSLESLSPDYGLSWELPLLSLLSHSAFHLLSLVGFYQHSSKLHGHSLREGWRNHTATSINDFLAIKWKSSLVSKQTETRYLGFSWFINNDIKGLLITEQLQKEWHWISDQITLNKMYFGEHCTVHIICLRWVHESYDVWFEWQNDIVCRSIVSLSLSVGQHLASALSHSLILCTEAP